MRLKLLSLADPYNFREPGCFMMWRTRLHSPSWSACPGLVLNPAPLGGRVQPPLAHTTQSPIKVRPKTLNPAHTNATWLSRGPTWFQTGSFQKDRRSHKATITNRTTIPTHSPPHPTQSHDFPPKMPPPPTRQSNSLTQFPSTIFPPSTERRPVSSIP